MNGSTGAVSVPTYTDAQAKAAAQTITTFTAPTVVSPVMTGTATLNGSPVVNAATLATATAGFVSSVNGVLPTAGNVAIPVATFVSGFTASSPGTVATLLSGAPCNSSRVGFYAVVSDLFSGSTSTNEVMRCSATGSTFYWRPQRSDYAALLNVTGGSVTLSCLSTPPVLFVNGTLLSNLTANLSTVNCWPGASFSIANNAVLGVYGLTFTGLVGGATKSLGLNGRTTFYFDGSAWQTF